MGSIQLDASVDAFLAAVSDLTGEQFAEVRAEGDRIGVQPRLDAEEAAALSAAEFSVADKRVRDTIKAIRGRLGDIGTGDIRRANTDTLFAVYGLLRRESLTREQYEALVGPFAGVPVPVPPYTA